MKKKEQEKKELEDVKEEDNRKCIMNAEEKIQEEVKNKWEEKEKNKIVKAKAAAMAAPAALRPKCEWRVLKKFSETSSSDLESSDSDAIVHEDSSDSEVDDTEHNPEGSTSFCVKCTSLFKDKDKETAIGCDMPYVHVSFTGDCRHQPYRNVQERNSRNRVHLQILLNIKLSVCSIRFDIIC